MNKRTVGKIVVTSLLITSIWGINSYAYEGELYVDTLETVPAGSEDVLLDKGTSGNNENNGMIIYDAIEPVEYVNETADTNSDGTPPKGDDSDDQVPGSTATELQEVTGASSLAGEGEVNIYSGNIIDMVLPVVPEKAYDFIMDPQDILSRYSNSKEDYSKSSIYFTSHTGGVLHRSTSDSALAINRSTVPVVLSVTLEVDNPYDWPVRFTDKSSVENDDEMNVTFELVPVSFHKSEGNADDVILAEGSESDSVSASETGSDNVSDGDTASGSDNTASDVIKDDIVQGNASDDGSKENGLNGTNTDGTTLSDNAEAQDPEDLASPFGNKDITELEGHRVSIDENGRAELQMFIPADINNFEKYGDGYILKEDADFTSYGWVVDGACNTKADWTDIIKKGKSKENINVHITYQMRALTGEEAAGMGDEVVFNL